MESLTFNESPIVKIAVAYLASASHWSRACWNKAFSAEQWGTMQSSEGLYTMQSSEGLYTIQSSEGLYTQTWYFILYTLYSYCTILHCRPVRSAVQTVLQCIAVKYSAALPSQKCSAVQCSAVQCSAVQCSAVQCSVVQCSAVRPSR
jgi:hypothetical protein